jgi:hypothetical protein
MTPIKANFMREILDMPRGNKLSESEKGRIDAFKTARWDLSDPSHV